MQTLEQFRKKFMVEELKVFSTQDITVSVRPTQITLGSLIVSSNHQAYSFHELQDRSNNTTDTTNVFSTIEKLLIKSYAPNLMNIMCLMLVDPIIHFHIFPRYDSERNFYNERWLDSCWPKPIDLSNIYPPTPDIILKEIKDDLRKIYMNT